MIQRLLTTSFLLVFFWEHIFLVSEGFVFGVMYFLLLYFFTTSDVVIVDVWTGIEGRALATDFVAVFADFAGAFALALATYDLYVSDPAGAMADPIGGLEGLDWVAGLVVLDWVADLDLGVADFGRVGIDFGRADLELINNEWLNDEWLLDC